MKYIALSILALFYASSSFADDVAAPDIALFPELSRPDLGYNIESRYGNIDYTKLDSIEGESGDRYYRNWLGEKCIDFGKDSKPYYGWKRELTYSGIPILVSALIVKDKKKVFRSARFTPDNNWSTKIDNYSQFSPYVLTAGLKVLGYEGRSSWDRLAVSAFASNVVMALAVNTTKHSAKELRPDYSTRNSFPSGHTATAFVAATVLHKEYGLTRSPWFSAGGYAVAMGTGFMRVLNNHHWISDVMGGAGIGILSTELGYFVGDVLYRNKGIMHLEATDCTNPDHPSFFDVQMGIGMHSGSIEFDFDDGSHNKIQLGTSTAVGVEGAYFLNKNVGVGGMLRATSTPSKDIGITDDRLKVYQDYNETLEQYGLPQIRHISIANSNFFDLSLDAGIYGNLPLTKHFSLGGKFLIGTRISSGCEYKAQAGYRQIARDAAGNEVFTGVITSGDKPSQRVPVYIFDNPDGTVFAANETLMPGVSEMYNYHLDPDKYVGNEYTISKVKGGKSFNYVCGLSFTYHYNENFSWKVFLDYDSAKTNYDYMFNLADDATASDMKDIALNNDVIGNTHSLLETIDKTQITGRAHKHLYLFTLGASFSISF